MEKIAFNKIAFFIILLTTFLLPLFFLPTTVDFYYFNKKLLLISSTAMLYLLWAIKSIQEKKLTFKKNLPLLPLGALVLTYWLSSLIQSPNRIFSLSGQTTTITSLILFYIATVNFIKSKNQSLAILSSIIISSVVISWLAIFSYLGLAEQLEIGPQWLQSRAWTPIGSPIQLIGFLVILLSISVFWAFKSKEGTEKLLLFIASAVQTLAIILTISLFINKTVQFFYLAPNFGWQICVEGFKNLRTALLGVGPDNFISAFSQFRPKALNLTKLWAVKFNNNSNYYFQLLSTIGLLGLIAYFWFIVKTVKKNKNNAWSKILQIGLIASLFIQLIINTTIVSLFTFFLLAALSEVLPGHSIIDIVRPGKSEAFELKTKIGYLSFSTITVLVSLFALFWHGRIWLADYYFRKSLVAAQENKGKETYDLQIKAIRLNPFNDNYRVTYSQTNFALANSLSNQQNLTDQAKQNVVQLISQAIREAKVAIKLNQQKADNWVNLAKLYRQLISFAKGADQWTLSSHVAAIRTDPTNPLLRLDLGSLYYASGDFDKAIPAFLAAINLKPDWANAYYNLAIVYKEKENYSAALENMQIVLDLVDKNSSDYEKAKEEFEALKEKVPDTAKTLQKRQEQASELTTPSPLPSAKPKFGEITLPEEEASPPEIPAADENLDEELLETTESAEPESSPSAP